MVLTWPAPFQDPSSLDLYLYKNNGGGNFNGGGGVHKIDVGGGGTTFGFIFSMDLTSGDFNNDGNADFVVNFAHYPTGHSTYPSQLTLFFYKNDGAGGFASNAKNINANDADNGVLWSNVVFKEATGDNFDDVIVSIYGFNYLGQSYYPGEIRVYKGGAQGLDMSVHWKHTFNQNDEWVFSVDVGEFTGDQNPDILISTDSDVGGLGDWDDCKIWLATGQGAQGYGNPADKIAINNQGAGQSLNIDNFDELHRDDFSIFFAWDTNADDIIDKWEIRLYTTNNLGAFQQKWADHTGQGGTLPGTVGVIWADDFDNSGAGDFLYAGKDLRLMDVRTGFEPDFIPPASITDLTVTQPGGMSDDTVKLQWTAPGDDKNSEGPAAHYLIHYANVTINEGNFNDTTNFTQAPQPAEPGTGESVDIPTLDSSTEYFFAIKAVDDVGNIALISNIVNFTMPDYIAPGKITDLDAEYIEGEGEIELTWTAPGDDDDQGTVDSYEVRFSDTDITNFASATEIVADIPAPQSPGSTESMRIEINNTTGMDFDATFYFAVIGEDESGNAGDMSNVDSVALPDIIPPSSVLITAEPGEGDGEVILSWDAPGDDGSEGNVDSYDIRYSTSLITEDNFDLADMVTGLPDPGDGGDDEVVTVTGLTGGTVYFFALKSFDEAMNPSSMSNVATARATDGTAPSKIKNVELVDTPGDNGGSLTLTWDISDAADFQAYWIYISKSEFTTTEDDDLMKEIEDINVTMYNITKLAGKSLEDGKDYYAGILAVDTSDNQGEIGIASSGSSPLDDLLPEILYFKPLNSSLKLEMDSSRTFNITAEFHDDDTRNIQWYVDDDDERGETKPLFIYEVPSTVGEKHTIKVELDDGTNKIENSWEIEVVGKGEGDPGDDDDDDDDDDDTGDDDDDDDNDDDNDDTGGDDDDPSYFTGIDDDEDGLDDGWEDHFFGKNVNPYADSDKDGITNKDEYEAGTDPTDGPASPTGGTSDEDKGALGQWLWYLVIGGALFFVLLIVLFLIIIISRKSKKKKEEEEAVPTPVDMSKVDQEAEDLYGRTSPPQEGVEHSTENLTPDQEPGNFFESPQEEAEEMESFFDAFEQASQPALPPATLEETGGGGILASLRAGDGDVSSEKSEKAEKKGGSLALDSLFGPILEDDDDLEEEEIGELAPIKSDEFGSNFLDDLLTLAPVEEEDTELVETKEDVLIKKDDIAKEDAAETQEPMFEVDCYNCSTGIPIYSDERPLVITCPNCGIQGEIE